MTMKDITTTERAKDFFHESEVSTWKPEKPKNTVNHMKCEELRNFKRKSTSSKKDSFNEQYTKVFKSAFTSSVIIENKDKQYDYCSSEQKIEEQIYYREDIEEDFQAHKSDTPLIKETKRNMKRSMDYNNVAKPDLKIRKCS